MADICNLSKSLGMHPIPALMIPEETVRLGPFSLVPVCFPKIYQPPPVDFLLAGSKETHSNPSPLRDKMLTLPHALQHRLIHRPPPAIKGRYDSRIRHLCLTLERWDPENKACGSWDCCYAGVDRETEAEGRCRWGTPSEDKEVVKHHRLTNPLPIKPSTIP